MKWSPTQEAAISAVQKWIARKDSQVFRLFGYAGTGKTTMAQELAKGLGTVWFAAYTGKAASVLQERGCKDASTIHSLIYLTGTKSKKKLNKLEAEYQERHTALEPDERQFDEVLQKLRRAIENEQHRLRQPAFTRNPDAPIIGADLIIIDECSMVDERMGQDLLSFDVPVLVLGDPAQLPPVGSGGFFTSGRPDVMLEEIHRQAQGNPIIEMATRVRQGKSLREGEFGESLVMKGRPDPQLVMGADQIIVGGNKTRRTVNLRTRELLGFNHKEPMPAPKDKLVCLKNDHDVGLLNGTLWTVVDSQAGSVDDKYTLKVQNGNGTVFCEVHAAFFKGTEKDIPYWQLADANQFDYGYALTCHKSQGSQWPSVFLFDESGFFRRDAQKWLYTAITRASERITICL